MTRSTQAHVLVVDDDETVRSVTTAAVQRMGFTVLAAENGLEAVEVFRQHRDDIRVVIMDLTMPTMSGEEAYRAIRTVRPDAAVIIMSGYNEIETSERFAGRGVAGFLQKPYEVARLRGSPRSTDQLLMATTLDAGGDAALSHLTGGAWWRVPGCSLKPFTITTTRSSRTPTRFARTHRVRALPDRWSTVLRGVPVARPELLALQIYAVCKEPRAERLVERMWSLRILSGASISAFLGDMGARGRDGTAGLRRYLAPRGLDYTPAASNLESRVLQILREAHIPMRRQVDSGGTTWTGRVDFRHQTKPVILEVQSAMYHDALIDRIADAARRRHISGSSAREPRAVRARAWSGRRSCRFRCRFRFRCQHRRPRSDRSRGDGARVS